jgi:glycosyltransferase involved in cell wall biosynthesis
VLPLPRLRIAHLYQESGIRFSEPHAAQLHIYHTIRGLQQAGHEVALLALQGRQVLLTRNLDAFRTETMPASQYARLGLSGSAPFKLFESGVRRLQSQLHWPYLALFDSYRMTEAACRHLGGTNVLHERFNLLSLGGAWASKRLRIPLVLEVNADLLEQREFKGIPETGLRRIFARWATRLCFNSAARIICISSDLQDHLRRKWQVPASKLAVLPCAADVEVYGLQDDAGLVRRRLGLTSEPVVMWIGGFYPWHDLELLVESMAHIVGQIPQTKLVLVGDGQTRTKLVERIEQSGLRDTVIMTGAIPHDRVPEMLSIADVAVVPAAPVAANRGGTGTPLKLFEYMAAGKAIVATAIYQAASVIQDGHTGLLVAPQDARQFADAVLHLLANASERVRLGQNARRVAIERYSWQEYTRQLEQIYLGMLAEPMPA